jgi:hypothetical protein
MREIKFRAWNSEEKTMLKPFDLSSNPKYWCDNLKDYPLMQYTGLKDKNGVEIYEGDIIKTDTDNIVSVEYSNYYGAYLFGGFPTNQDEIYKLEIEVIGNIYENPELLDK